MVLKRVASILAVVSMLFTSLTIPVNAELSVNIGGSTGGSWYQGDGGMDKAWSPGNLSNRSGYRISIYYAPQAQDDSGNYLYDDNGDPVYDWDQVKPVGNKIDIRRDAMRNNDDGSVRAPNVWGYRSVWDYLSYGGAYKTTFKGQGYDSTDDKPYIYYYYQFTNQDRYNRNTSSEHYSNMYVCALFNSGTLTYDYSDETGAGANITDESFIGENSSYMNIVNRLEKINSSTSDEKIKNIINDTLLKLQKSNDYVRAHYDLPLVNNSSEKTSGNIVSDNNVDDLSNYLINPVILNLISDACNGKFTAEDFYFGSWDGAYSTDWETKASTEKKYPRGTYKMIVETMTTTGLGDGIGVLTSYTLADSIAKYNNSKELVYVMLGSGEYLNDMANSLTLIKKDSVLRFGTEERFMGDKIENDEPQKIDVSKDWTNKELWEECDSEGILGNYSGLAVIDSDSISAKADIGVGSMINEVSVSWLGKENLGVTNIQVSMDANDLSKILSDSDINVICQAFTIEDVNTIAEQAGITDAGAKLQLTALCDSIRRGMEYGLSESDIRAIIRDAYNWDSYDTATKQQKINSYGDGVNKQIWFTSLYSIQTVLSI